LIIFGKQHKLRASGRIFNEIKTGFIVSEPNRFVTLPNNRYRALHNGLQNYNTQQNWYIKNAFVDTERDDDKGAQGQG